jgi:hypothetical protein
MLADDSRRLALYASILIFLRGVNPALTFAGISSSAVRIVY